MKLFPTGFPTHSTYTIPSSPRTRLWAAACNAFGTGYLPHVSAPSGALQLHVMDRTEPATEDYSLPPSALCSLSPDLRHNPLRNAYPAESDDCPADEKFVPPEKVPVNCSDFIDLLPVDYRDSAASTFPPGMVSHKNFLTTLASVEETAISLMQGRPASPEQLAAVQETGLPVSTWMQCINCLRLQDIDTELVKTALPQEDPAFRVYQLVHFLSRLSFTDPHALR